MRRVVIIMAGGAGERFWPASRRSRPKQLLRLTDPKRTLIAEAVERISPLIPPADVYIATNRALQQPIRLALPNVPPENVLAEPARRNTAGCLTFAASCLAARFDDPASVSAAVLTADHAIGDEVRFRELVDLALERAEESPELVTIGIAPTRPETGYGYIEVAGDEAPSAGRAGRVAAFHEKPDRETAERFVASGHLWNSGMFFFRLNTFLAALEEHLPFHAEGCRALQEIWRRSPDESRGDELLTTFEALPSVSIDVGVFEKARNVSVVPADFPWDDVGAWDALARVRPRDTAGNVIDGEPIVLDSEGCIVYDDAKGARLIAVLGCDDLVVVSTDDAILVCPKSRAQDVRRIVSALKERGREDLL
ncbi:MAG: sugar phosphate nucleotidyltransferase [Planctomycetota bacterium]